MIFLTIFLDKDSLEYTNGFDKNQSLFVSVLLTIEIS